MKLLRIAFALGCSLFFVTEVVAQTNVTTSGGTTNTVPVFTGTSVLGGSPIWINGSNVGIGTTGPVSALTLGGSGNPNPNTGSQIDYIGEHLTFTNYSSGLWQLGGIRMVQPTGYYGDQGNMVLSVGAGGGSTLDAVTIQSPSGNVGVGTTSPLDRFNVMGLSGQITMGDGGNYNPYIHFYRWTGTGDLSYQASLGNSLTTAGALEFQTGSGGAVIGSDAQTTRMLIMPSTGNVGIGTTLPGAKLEVNGSIKLSTSSGASITFPDTTVQSTAWTGVLSGGDYAESVNVSGARNEYEPGDVLVIDPASEGNFLKSSAPYSTSVTGIYSTKPGVVGRRQHSAQEHMKEEVPMAMTGIVPTKVSAENGPIKPGDLLVTSSKAGYAMRGTNHKKMMGAVIGKAIGHLNAGVGVIEAVVTLQ